MEFCFDDKRNQYIGYHYCSLINFNYGWSWIYSYYIIVGKLLSSQRIEVSIYLSNCLFVKVSLLLSAQLFFFIYLSISLIVVFAPHNINDSLARGNSIWHCFPNTFLTWFSDWISSFYTEYVAYTHMHAWATRHTHTIVISSNSTDIFVVAVVRFN